MGCRTSKTSRDEIGFTHAAGTHLYSSIPGHGNALVEVVTPDPDLGWRRVQSPVTGASVHHQAAVVTTRGAGKEWCSRSGDTISGSNSDAIEQQYPIGWNVYFFNDRSGNYCQTSLVTLAMNIAIRAEQLARAFGVLNDPLSSDTHTNNIASKALSKLESSRREVYVSLGIPDFGWVLLSRNETSSTPLDTARSSFQNGGAQPRRHCKDKLTASSLGHSSNVLQLLQSGGGPERKRLLLADVPSIGMNIAEQLHRLERKRDNRHFLPTDAFGWTVIGPSQQQNGLGVMVSMPQSEPISIVPEEIIMNTTQWVQQTYFTSALL